jgi:hypothetical protein
MIFGLCLILAMLVLVSGPLLWLTAVLLGGPGLTWAITSLGIILWMPLLSVCLLIVFVVWPQVRRNSAHVRSVTEVSLQTPVDRT